ncbi:ankyrin repeat protein [Colletotrichum chrysophilum]|uniref:Ankyrin repeat domain-containing protein 54 n=1 Tax=Colletotrichum chrysophilum TaxID=1836956 RepID=A0AAD9AZV6_9PEZI|nr:ankyrin repeat protein [Colletotrichum chrysophilum]
MLLLRALMEHHELARCLNTSGETFLHCLAEEWYLGDAIYLRVLLRHLAFDDGPDKFNVFSKDVYGRSVFHLMTESISNQKTLSELMEPFDRHAYMTRDAFGVIPGEIRAQTTSQSPKNKIDMALVIENQAQLLHTINRAYHDNKAEHDGGRNALHCIASVVLSQDSLLAFNNIPNLSAEHPDLLATNSQVGEKSTQKQKELDSLAKFYKQREDVVLDLIGIGVNVNAYDAAGNTVLMHFVTHLSEDYDRKTSINIIDQILESGAAIQARNRTGETALHVAVRHGRKLAMMALVLKGANVHARDKNGRTPLRTLAYEIQKPGNDSATYAHLEACFAWLSGQAEAKLRSSVLDEWGWSGLPALPARRGTGLSESGRTDFTRYEEQVLGIDRIGLTSLDECYEESHVNSVINCHARDGKSQRVIKRLRDVLEEEQDKEFSKMKWKQQESLGKIEVVKKRTQTYEDERSTLKQPSMMVKIEQSEETANSSTASIRDNNPSIDDMCGAFNISISQVFRPEEAWQSVRRCLNELEVIALLPRKNSSGLTEGHCQVANNGSNDHSKDSNIEQEASGSSHLPDGGHSGIDRDRKRRRSDASGSLSRKRDDNNDERNDGNGSENGPKKRNKGKTKGRYTCPYRKRNPIRFNVREHQSCALVAFDSISLVK